MTKVRNLGLRLCAAALALTLGLCPTARAAGLFDWLTGEPEATEAAAIVEPSPAPEAVATLPPAEEVWQFDAPEATPAPTFEPVPEASIEDDGMLRVALRSLEAPRQLHLTLAGVYAVDGDPGFRFDRDTRVALSAAEGRVYLSVGGLTIDMGQSVALTRHRAEAGEENGIYIDEAEHDDALYCGDLTVSAEGETLRAVLKLQIEDYLYGVVAYEMSDSFPIEALKAQAVAARTYAMQRKWQAGSRDYDLVDTTADQVFKGYDPQYANVIQAVDDTRGVVGLYDGRFAVCYYTASNGGQTALASQLWGTTDADGYLSMRDDPYDLENPRSLQNELTVSPQCEGSAALKGMLEAALGEALAAEGYGEGEWALDSIAAIQPVNPRFEGSRLYDGLEFELRARLLVPVATPTPEPTDTPAPTDAPEASEDEAVSEAVEASPEAEATPEAAEATPEADAESKETAASPEPEPSEAPETADDAAALAEAFTGEAMPTAPDAPLPEPAEVPREWVLSEETYRVTLDVFGQIKGGLSLGLNGSDCELISVETERNAAGEATAFTLVMRRFGHGVGMSQRGAQWMAGQYGMTWRDIIAFYYPGLSVERMAWPEAALTDLAALPDSVGAARPKPTPTPTPAPLPPLKEGERYARVNATYLNLREQPTTASRAIDQLAGGREVIVSSEPDADGWVQVHTAEAEGFVKEEYLEYGK